MRIPNKFNGYSRDGVRLYNDPGTLAALAAGSTGVGTMAGVVAPTIAAVTPTVAAVTPALR
jgi:hypothetical protein